MYTCVYIMCMHVCMIIIIAYGLSLPPAARNSYFAYHLPQGKPKLVSPSRQHDPRHLEGATLPNCLAASRNYSHS